MKRNFPPVFSAIILLVLLRLSLPVITAQHEDYEDWVTPRLITNISYSPDGDLLFVMTSNGLDVYQTVDFTIAPEHWSESYISGVGFSSDQTQMYLEYYNSSEVIDRKTGEIVDQVAGTNLIFIPDDLLLMQYGPSYLIQKSDESFPSISSSRTPQNTEIVHIRGLFFDERRDQIVVHADLWGADFFSRVIRTYSPITHEIIDEYPLNELSNLQIDMSSNYQWIASAGWTEIELLHLETDERFPIHWDELNSQIAFSPDSQFLAVGTFNGLVAFWDVNTRKMQDKVYQHDSVVSHITFNSHQTQIAVVTMDGRVTIRDFVTDEVIAVLHRYDPHYTFSQYSNPNPQLLYADVHDLDSLWYFYDETRLQLTKTCQNPMDDTFFNLKEVAIPLDIACRILESSPITIYTERPY